MPSCENWITLQPSEADRARWRASAEKAQEYVTQWLQDRGRVCEFCDEPACVEATLDEGGSKGWFVVDLCARCLLKKHHEGKSGWDWLVGWKRIEKRGK